MNLALDIRIDEREIIKTDNIILCYLLTISTNFSRILKVVDKELFENTNGAIENLKDVLRIDLLKNKKGFVKKEVEKGYKTLKSYMKGINERIGNTNDNKSKDILVKEANELFDAKLEEVQEESKKNGSVILSDVDSIFYVQVGVGIEIIKDYLKKDDVTFKKNDVRYIKTFITKLSNWYESDMNKAIKKADLLYKEYLRTKTENKIKEFKKVKIRKEKEKLPTTKNSATKKIINLLQDINQFEKSLSRKYGEFTDEELEKTKKDYKKYKLKDLIEEYQYLSSNFVDIKNKIGMVG